MYVKRCVLNQYQIYIYIHIDIHWSYDCTWQYLWPFYVLAAAANCDQVTKKINETSKCQFPSEYLWLRVWFFFFSGGRSTSIRVEGSKKIQETMSEICVLPAMESLDSTWCTNALPWYHWSGRLCCHSRRPGLRISQDIKLLDVPNQILLSS